MKTLTLAEAKAIMDNNGGNLDLYNTQITSLPNNLKVGGGLYLDSTPITSLPDNLTVGGWLDLHDTQITSLPNNLTVGGNLRLHDTQITSLPDNLTVGGSLDLRGTPITSLPDNLTVGGSLYLNNSQITSLPDNLTVGGGLDLRGTPITSLPDNLTVGGGLYLNNTPITSLPNNLTVGGWLDLCGTQITSLPDNLAVGRKVYSDIGFKCDNHCKLKDGEYVPNRYLYADGILTHVKGKKTIKGYDFYIGKIKGKNVVSDGTHYAHCSNFREGIADLLFKSAKDRGAKQYSHLTLESEVTAEDAITMYRIITGACRQGTRRFVDGLGKLKDKYTVREIINITQGQYNSEAFRKFFE